MSAPIPAFTPVDLLTGFLGSGKTTLLGRLLADPALAHAAVLINEFGEVGLDHLLVERVDGETVLLKSGCVCCTVRGELATAIRNLHGRRERGAIPAFDRLVVESSGLADPFPILSTLKADPVLRHHFRAGSVVTTVDAVNGLATLAAHPESVRQAAAADRIVVTKSDLCPAAETAALVGRIGALNPGAALLDARDTPTAEVLFGRDLQATAGSTASARAWFAETFRAQAAEPGASAARGHGSSGLERIRSVSLTIDQPVDWTAFGLWLTMLLNRHGAAVLRVKGILALAGEERPVAIHGVQHLVHPPVHMNGWPTDDRRSRLVFILDGIDPAQLRRSLAACIGLAGAP